MNPTRFTPATRAWLAEAYWAVVMWPAARLRCVLGGHPEWVESATQTGRNVCARCGTNRRGGRS